MTADAITGRPQARAWKPIARGSRTRPVAQSPSARARRKANTAIAGSAIGMPPHTVSRRIEE